MWWEALDKVNWYLLWIIVGDGSLLLSGHMHTVFTVTH